MSGLSTFVVLIVGIIIGWLLSWVFERNQKAQVASQVTKLESDLHATSDELTAYRGQYATLERDANTRISSLETALNSRSAELNTCTNDLNARTSELSDCTSQLNARIGDLSACTGQLNARAAELDAAQVRIAELQNELEQSQALVQRAGSGNGMATRAAGITVDLAQQTDDLTEIRGIGPTIAARLAATGITSYADLANANPQELPQALGLHPWQKVDPGEWVTQAETLAKRPRQVSIGDDLTELEGIGPTYAIRLRAAGITTFRQLADTNVETLAEITGAPAWKRINYGAWIEQARLVAAGDHAGLRALQDQLFKRSGDNLDLIAGVGDNSLAALQNAGITSYSALAQATPDQIHAILQNAGVRGGNPENWIAEAKQRAAGKRVRRTTTRSRSLGATQERTCPQDLEEVAGIGQMYEQRLYAHGIGTYWELAMLPADELSTLLELQPFQKTDIAAIQSAAMRLAQETNTMGHVWDGTEPDDFDGLEGVGPVFERRLYAAGVCTYAALAAVTRERLEEICQAPSFNRPDFARWIEQARAIRGQPA